VDYLSGIETGSGKQPHQMRTRNVRRSIETPTSYLRHPFPPPPPTLQFFEIGSGYVAQAGLKLTILLSFLSTGIKDVHHYAFL
jgi:hypothetical protein